MRQVYQSVGFGTSTDELNFFAGFLENAHLKG